MPLLADSVIPFLPKEWQAVLTLRKPAVLEKLGINHKLEDVKVAPDVHGVNDRLRSGWMCFHLCM
ncbi:hypothetical protein EK904_010722 [Melospiza melodia maxima]|nr:hypothetical protein EK904_010722 [Melospiza melodia maxima]